MARWALISGENGVESTAYASRLVESLAAAGLRSEGLLKRKHVDENDRKYYELARLRNDESVLSAAFGVPAKEPGAEAFCSMVFYKNAFEAAGRWLEEDAPDADLLVIDGVGKFEASGRGLHPALAAALRRTDQIVLLCARASQLFHVVERFGLEEEDMAAAFELPVDAAGFDLFSRDVLTACLAERSNRQR
jgi:nucleoside-triphosphatase THEP1